MNKLTIVVVAIISLGLPGCLTTTLWGGDLIETDDGDTRLGYELPRGSDSGPDGAEIARRVLLTPFALAVDCITLPVQSFVFGWNEEDWDDD